METRTLVYWKQRQVDLRNCIAMTKPTSQYWADLWVAYRIAARHVEQIERRFLVKHHV